jgi:3D-(3,5/4)-trihydroxycyclohexane-1,2-dione acylhydrolase (decyclizing)
MALKTVHLTMAQALLRFLDAQYLEADGIEHKFVRGVFGIFGHGNVVGLGEALAEEKTGLAYYQGHNEQGMAHTAIGFAKQSNRKRIFAVTSSIGPGALNMVTAAGTATVNRIPVLFLPGDAFACRQPDPVLQQVEQFHDLNLTANDAFKPVSRFWDRINRPEQLLSAALNAMRVLTDPADTGAVTLALPQDVQGEAYDYPAEFLARRVHHLERRAPTEGELQRALAMIRASQRPLLICGGGVRYSEAARALKSFCARFRVPFAETQAGKGVLPWDDPWNLGGIGVTGGQAANRIAREADLLIAVGTRLGDFTTASKWLFHNPSLKVLGVNVAPFDAGKLNALPMVADARSALTILTRALGRTGYRAGYGGEIERARADWSAEVDRLYAAEDPGGLSQTLCLGELDRRLPKDAIVVGASGSLPGDLQRLWRPRRPGGYHMEYGFSCMGYEIAGALGAKLAEPEREVFALAGDGSYVMLHSELLTSLQEGLKINVVVFDNQGFGCIENLQESQGITRFGNERRARSSQSGRLTGEVLELDFARNAQSYGARGLSARTLEEFRRALRRALKESRSTVIDVKVTPKSMTGGYDSWWRVGTAEVSRNPQVAEAAAQMKKEIERARKL